MEQTAKLVTKEMNIGEVLELHPDAGAIMQSYGLQCLGCHVNLFESIEKGAKGHGMTDEQVDQMLVEVNKAISDVHSTAPAVEHSGEPLLITPAAAETMKALLEKSGKAEYGIRIAVRAGGCSGSTYAMDLENTYKDGDTILDANGVKVYVDVKSAEKLWGTQVDFIQTLNESGFRFSNPNARTGCGCGKSFR